ncbi:DUF4157 domain-containing protein [Pseudomonadota bacterium]
MQTFARKGKPTAEVDKTSGTLAAVTSPINTQRATVREILSTPYPQTKLTIGQPNDRYEQEADRVADRVMRMSEPGEGSSATQNKNIPAQSDNANDTLSIQRMCTDCDEELKRKPDIDEQLQRKESTKGVTPNVSAEFASGIQSLRGGGQPLSDSARGFFEPRFGRGFGDVRVHTGNHANQLARDINAKAFTLGRDVVFGQGHYQPHSTEGQHLMAHELTHVVQQQAGQRQSIQRVTDDDLNFRAQYSDSANSSSTATVNDEIVMLVGGERSVGRSWQNFMKAAVLRISSMGLSANQRLVVIVYSGPYVDRAADPGRPASDPADYLAEFDNLLGGTGKSYVLVKAATEADIFSTINSRSATISRFEYFGHGLAGELAIGYNDPVNSDSISVSDVTSLNKAAFASDAVFISWACNSSTATGGGGVSFTQAYQAHIGGTAVGASALTNYGHVAHSAYDVFSTDRLPYIENKRAPGGQWKLSGSGNKVHDSSFTLSLSMPRSNATVSTRESHDTSGFDLHTPKAAMVEVSQISFIQGNGSARAIGANDKINLCLKKDNILSNPSAGCQNFSGTPGDTVSTSRSSLFPVNESGEHFVNLNYAYFGGIGGKLKGNIKVYEV